MATIREGQPISLEQTQRIVRLPDKVPVERIGDSFYRKDIISLEQFDPESIAHLFSYVPEMEQIAYNGQPSQLLAGKLVYSIFYEASSRTKGSFSMAVRQLGGQVEEEGNPKEFSSIAKGETFEDSINVYEAYCDAIILRHPDAGSAQKAAETALTVPVINAGDGIGEHPTQALLDLYTIYEKFGKLDHLKGVIAGDVKNGRTVHSLLEGLALYPGNEVYLMSPDILRLEHYALKYFKLKGLNIHEISNQKDMPKDANFWYWTRVQKERFDDEEEYLQVNNRFIVDKKLLKKRGNSDMILMHPMPRVGEILTEVDSDPRAVFKRSQVRNGMYVRMALMGLVLGALK